MRMLPTIETRTAETEMTGTVNSPGVAEKNPLRDEITEQIRAYLEKGGEINVTEPKVREPVPAADSGWVEVDDDFSPEG